MEVPKKVAFLLVCFLINQAQISRRLTSASLAALIR